MPSISLYLLWSYQDPEYDVFMSLAVPKPDLLKVAVNVSSSGKPVLRYMYYVNEPGLTLLMKKTS